MRVLDLFSGLGGFSEAFVNHGWEVCRLENNPLLAEVPYTHIMDVVEFRDQLLDAQRRGLPIKSVDVIVASPPCYEFSMGFNAPRAIASRENRLDEYKPNMELLDVAREIIKILKPKYWIIENVQGACRYFEPVLGPHRQRVGAFFFWGNFPLMHIMGKVPTKAEKDKRHEDLRSNYRAKVPIQISQALLVAILSQTSIFDFCQRPELD